MEQPYVDAKRSVTYTRIIVSDRILTYTRDILIRLARSKRALAANPIRLGRPVSHTSIPRRFQLLHPSCCRQPRVPPRIAHHVYVPCRLIERE